jgi:CARDB
VRPKRDAQLGVVLSLLAIAFFVAEVGSGATTATGEPGATRPDLVEITVSSLPRMVGLGGAVRVTDAVRNRGDATAPRSVTGYYLSRDRVYGTSDRRLAGRFVRSLRPRATSRGSRALRIPTSVAPGQYRVLACADDRHRFRESSDVNNCRAGMHVVKVSGDPTPPRFGGLRSAITCIPGPGGRGSAPYRLSWEPATDNITPSSALVYDVYQATVSGREDFSSATYTSPAGVTSFSTPPLPTDRSYYFVVRARDRAGNRDSNKLERQGENQCR